MGTFSYTGVDFSGHSVTGEAKVHDVTELERALRADGVLLVEARKRAVSPLWLRIFSHNRHEISVTRYFRHLSTLVGAGVPLSKALDGLSERAQGAAWSLIVSDIADHVRRGSSFGDALRTHDAVFSGVAVPMIAAGEAGGNLGDVLERVAVFREKWESVGRKVRGALVYPIVVSVVAIAVVWIMLAYVVPVFSQMFTNLGAELPAPTRFLLSISKLSKTWWWVVPILAVGALSVFQTIKTRPSWRLTFARQGVRLPVVGEMLAKTAIARVARTASTLLDNGVPLLSALRTSAVTAGNAAIEKVFLDAADTVERGRPLSESLSDWRDMPSLASQILSTGEETANLGRMFGKLADFYEAETDASVGVITTVIEPALIVIMGIIVAGILIALYLPMFDVLSHIGA
jgi:type IV pilus assembly protein PilC